MSSDRICLLLFDDFGVCYNVNSIVAQTRDGDSILDQMKLAAGNNLARTFFAILFQFCLCFVQISIVLFNSYHGDFLTIRFHQYQGTLGSIATLRYRFDSNNAFGQPIRSILKRLFYFQLDVILSSTNKSIGTYARVKLDCSLHTQRLRPSSQPHRMKLCKYF